MALLPLQIPPGVFRNGTELNSAGRWYDVNLVRWVEGTMHPVGGWEARTTTAVTGAARGIIAWRSNNNLRFIGIGTNSNLYAVTQSNAVVDITPTGFVPGPVNATAYAGYGIGDFASGYFGTPRPDSGNVIPAASWSLDNWGEYLIGCCNSDGKLYEWQLDYTTPTKAQQIANSPVNCTGLLSTNERSIMALGAGGDPRRIEWCDFENNTIWTAAATNTAGGLSLQTPGKIVAGRRVRGQTLIVTDVDAHVISYVGAPFMYQADHAGRACGIVGANAIAALDSFAVWMGGSGFYIYDGYVKPLSCEVADYLFSDFNFSQMSKVAAVNNSEFNEVWWLYPSADSNENNRYVAWNYKDNYWTYGQLARTCGTDRGVFSTPMMIGTNGIIYNHEVGLNYGGDAAYAESGPVQIGNGDNIMYVNELIPDERNQGDVVATFKTRYYPNSPEQTHGPYSLTNPTSVRFNGRQVKMRVTAVNPSEWRVGTQRLNAKAGGLR